LKLQKIRVSNSRNVTYSFDKKSGIFLVDGVVQTPLDPVSDKPLIMGASKLKISASAEVVNVPVPEEAKDGRRRRK
jgi:hypothetical protein